jgi:hypothetical protein
VHGRCRDRWGSNVDAADQQAVDLFSQAVAALVTLTGDPGHQVRAAVAADPDLAMGHILGAYLALYATSGVGMARARAAVDGIGRPGDGAGERERLHELAVRAWVDGDWIAATDWLERALLHDPRDLLALKVVQDLHFFLGHQAALRDVPGRVHAAWPPERPGWGWVQGIYAFGLEENAEYDEAEARARMALADDAGDVWAVHAMAHVHEMRDPPAAGIAFLERSAPDWAASFFAPHNWWHRALCHLERQETDEALALYDGPLGAARAGGWPDTVDAASLLWRLSLVGVDVVERAARLADEVALLADEPVYVFNDWHATMALGLAGRHGDNERLLSANRHRSVGSNRAAGRAVGWDLMEAFAAYAAGHPGRTVDLLDDLGDRAQAVGGSNAQRDVIELTALAAAARDGQLDRARALVARRRARKPTAGPASQRVLAANAALGGRRP